MGLLFFKHHAGNFVARYRCYKQSPGVGGLDFIFKPCRQVHSAICNLSRAHPGPLNPSAHSAYLTLAACRLKRRTRGVGDPHRPPSLLATDRKQFLQIIPIPALDGFHLVRLPSGGSRPRASGVDPAASSTASHLTSETLRLETETSHKWDRRCHAAVFFRGTNLTGHLYF